MQKEETDGEEVSVHCTTLRAVLLMMGKRQEGAGGEGMWKDEQKIT